MPIQIQIEDKTKSLQRLADQLSDKNITVANVRAINVAIRKANTDYRRNIVKAYKLKYSDTKKMAVAGRATYTNPEGNISGSKTPISLSRFNPTFINAGQSFTISSIKNKETGKRGLQQKAKKAGKNARSGGVTFEIQKGTKKIIPFAFLVNSSKPGMSMQVWARGQYSGNKFITGKGRKPLTALKTVSPYGMMTTEESQKEIEQSASESMRKEFERQVDLLIKKAGGK